jgi:hypothetical protein
LKHVRFKLGIRKHRGCILDLRVQLDKILPCKLAECTIRFVVVLLIWYLRSGCFNSFSFCFRF